MKIVRDRNKILLGANQVKDGKLIENLDGVFSPTHSLDSDGSRSPRSYMNPFNVVND